MRMIGIGLMGFLLAGVALLLSTMNILEQGHRYVREITSGPQLIFEHRAPALSQDADQAVVLRANSDHPVILSGFPAYQSVAFILPIDARPTSGYLQIDATSQVLDGVEGVLRISIQNTRRGEMLLRSGEVGRSLQIPLSPTDFAGDQLVVSFSLQGIGPRNTCGPDDGFEAVVEIETTSAIFLTLDRPLQSPRDHVRAWGNLARIAWPHWLNPDEQVRRLMLATQLQRRGIATTFTASPDNPGLTTVELREALPAFSKPSNNAPAFGALAQSGQNAGVRRFHRQAVWRERYEVGRGTDVYPPHQLDLHMQLGRLLGDQHWALSVTLNNRLLYQGHIPGAQVDFKERIDLPADVHTTENILEIVATTTTTYDSNCEQGPELVSEMLPSSRLVAGDTPYVGPLSEVRAALATVGPVNVTMTDALHALDAKSVSTMLDQVIPQSTVFRLAGNAPHVTVLAPGATLPTLPETGPTWLLTPNSSAQDLTVLKLNPSDAVSVSGPALLITPQAPNQREAEG